ncbi:hypothetical protein [Marinomonas transparens]|uniref:Uncharacterized protein n=1 Tax=Marinomonas transparens TaxID=2795388 RepID=A0A934JJY1_9GAMM|nr:hypothetical protein [Marinomonas transparens]MBJ7537181.1 hypothetical protein [Marinomonas transparens]
MNHEVNRVEGDVNQEARGLAMNQIDLTPWGSEPPHFIVLLADAVAQSSRATVARQIGVSRSAVSTLLSNRYPSKTTNKIERKVVEALGRVDCPTLGDITSARCHRVRIRPFMSTNSQTIAQFRACANCPNNPNRRSNSYEQ